jgi:hypothetical protein
VPDGARLTRLDVLLDGHKYRVLMVGGSIIVAVAVWCERSATGGRVAPMTDSRFYWRRVWTATCGRKPGRIARAVLEQAGIHA